MTIIQSHCPFGFVSISSTRGARDSSKVSISFTQYLMLKFIWDSWAMSGLNIPSCQQTVMHVSVVAGGQRHYMDTWKLLTSLKLRESSLKCFSHGHVQYKNSKKNLILFYLPLLSHNRFIHCQSHRPFFKNIYWTAWPSNNNLSK